MELTTKFNELKAAARNNYDAEWERIEKLEKDYWNNLEVSERIKKLRTKTSIDYEALFIKFDVMEQHLEDANAANKLLELHKEVTDVSFNVRPVLNKLEAEHKMGFLK